MPFVRGFHVRGRDTRGPGTNLHKNKKVNYIGDLYCKFTSALTFENLWAGYGVLVAQNKELLMGVGITHVINCRHKF